MVKIFDRDIPTLNKSVNEFRALIQSNNERTQRAEERKKKADLDAQKRLANTLKEVEEKLGDLPAAQQKANLELKASQEKLDALKEKLEANEESLEESTAYQKQLLDLEDKRDKADEKKFAERTKELNEQRTSILDQQDDREKQRVREQEMKTLAIKTLGIDEARFEEQKKASDEAKGARDRLNELKTQLESQGIDIKENTNFQKLQLEVEKKERRARLKAMTPASELKERAKDSATYLKNLLGKYLGPNSRIGGLLFSIAGNLKSKVTGAISSLFGLLKTGALVAGLAALLVFLDSQYWKDLKAKIIPKLEAGFIRLKEAFSAIIDAFIGENGSFENGIREIFVQIFGKDSNTVKSVNKILESFLVKVGLLEVE